MKVIVLNMAEIRHLLEIGFIQKGKYMIVFRE